MEGRKDSLITNLESLVSTRNNSSDEFKCSIFSDKSSFFGDGMQEKNDFFSEILEWDDSTQVNDYYHQFTREGNIDSLDFREKCLVNLKGFSALALDSIIQTKTTPFISQSSQLAQISASNQRKRIESLMKYRRMSREFRNRVKELAACEFRVRKLRIRKMGRKIDKKNKNDNNTFHE